MSEETDPPRLLSMLSGSGEDGAQDLLAALEAGKSELPTADQLDGLWARLPEGPGGDGGDGGPDGDGSGGDDDLGPGDLDPGGLDGGLDLVGGAGGASAAVKAAGGSATAVKVAAGGGIAVKAAGGAGLAKIIGAVVLAGAAVGTPAYLSTRGGEESALSPSTTAVFQAPAPTHGLSLDASAAPPADVTPPVASQDALPDASVTPPSPRPSPSVPAPSEVELLKQAQSALGSNPGRALALVNRASQLYPRGSLGQERTMIRIQALIGVGRRGEAHAAATAFRASHPGSPHNRRLEALFPELAQ